MLDREEYVEQAHFFRSLKMRIEDGIPTQDLLSSVREEILATTKLPMAIDFMASELRHHGVFATAMNKLAEVGLFFADSPSQTMAAIYATAQDRKRILAREGKRLGLVVVDHLGLVKPSAEALRRASREQQVAETSRALRFLASEIGCHVIGIAQLHRDAEKQGPGSMPKLHHLRESGSIEQDADLVLILHRERDQKTGMFVPNVPAHLAVAKGRLDETSTHLLQYEPHRARFSTWTGPVP